MGSGHTVVSVAEQERGQERGEGLLSSLRRQRCQLKQTLKIQTVLLPPWGRPSCPYPGREGVQVLLLMEPGNDHKRGRGGAPPPPAPYQVGRAEAGKGMGGQNEQTINQISK